MALVALTTLTTLTTLTLAGPAAPAPQAPQRASIAPLDARSSPTRLAQGRSAGVDKLMFHYNRQRTGWNSRETVLTPQAVSSAAFGLLWESAPLDSFDGRPPRLFAAPLYVHAVEMSQGPLAGRTVSALYAVTTAGYAYAINAEHAGDTKPGAVLWRRRLTDQPCDGLGNLSTPIIDPARNRLYLTMCSGDTWRAYALDLRSGQQLPGWPVAVDSVAIDAPGIQRNGNVRHWGADAQPAPDSHGAWKVRRLQRGALALSADGARLYLPFGEPGGWIVSIDVDKARVASAFSSTAADAERVMGGIWASGGPSIDDQGYIYVSTGTSGRNGDRASVFEHSPGNWGQSILQLRDDPVTGFALAGTYTPFNYCVAAAWDVDLGSSGVVVLDLDPNVTSTSRLIAIGGAKQGSVYLINRAPMPGSRTRRPPCSDDPESDLSLLAPDTQSQYGRRGPIHVFPPYAENKGYLDQARSRSTLAYFRDVAGDSYVFVTGAAKTGPELDESAPPGLAKLKIVTAPGKSAFLRIAQLEMTQTLQNASSPIVTSNGADDAIVWVLDTNGKRSAPLYGPSAPLAVLYAFDATTLKLLWKSAPGQLATTGKYNEATVLNGVAYVGTDRIQAFGLRPRVGGKFATPTTSASTTAPKNAPRIASSLVATSGRGLFVQRCASCHATPGADAPQQAVLSRRSRKEIVEALVRGPMRPQARGLTPSQIDSIAVYLTSGVRDSAGTVRSVLDFESARFSAMLRSDTAWLRAALAADLRYVHSTGQVDTKEAYLRAVGARTLRYEAFTPKERRVRLLSDRAAVVTGSVHARVLITDEAFVETDLRYTSVYELSKSSWLLVAWQTTRVP